MTLKQYVLNGIRHPENQIRTFIYPFPYLITQVQSGLHPPSSSTILFNRLLLWNQQNEILKSPRWQTWQDKTKWSNMPESHKWTPFQQLDSAFVRPRSVLFRIYHSTSPTFFALKQPLHIYRSLIYLTTILLQTMWQCWENLKTKILPNPHNYYTS